MAHILDKDNRNRLSKLVSEQLPEFIKGDHTTLVAFIEAYYEYLEQNQKPIEMNNGFAMTTQFLSLSSRRHHFTGMETGRVRPDP